MRTKPRGPRRGRLRRIYVKRGRVYKVLTGKGKKPIETIYVPERLSRARPVESLPPGARKMERRR